MQLPVALQTLGKRSHPEAGSPEVDAGDGADKTSAEPSEQYASFDPSETSVVLQYRGGSNKDPSPSVFTGLQVTGGDVTYVINVGDKLKVEPKPPNQQGNKRNKGNKVVIDPRKYSLGTRLRLLVDSTMFSVLVSCRGDVGAGRASS
jgi:hypothetical protein